MAPQSSAALTTAPVQEPALHALPRSVALSAALPLVRWSAVAVGVCSTFAVSALMVILGVAIGFSALEAHNLIPVLSVGAGVWGVTTVAISFFLGGWMAGRTTGVTDTFSQVLHGALVWIVTVPLVVYLLAEGVGELLLSTAGEAVHLGVQTAPGEPLPKAFPPASITPEALAHAAAHVGHGAWNVLSTLLLGLIAAGFGGFVGNKQERLYEGTTGNPPYTS